MAGYGWPLPLSQWSHNFYRGAPISKKKKCLQYHGLFMWCVCMARSRFAFLYYIFCPLSIRNWFWIGNIDVAGCRCCHFGNRYTSFGKSNNNNNIQPTIPAAEKQSDIHHIMAFNKILSAHYSFGNLARLRFASHRTHRKTKQQQQNWTANKKNSRKRESI